MKNLSGHNNINRMTATIVTISVCTASFILFSNTVFAENGGASLFNFLNGGSELSSQYALDSDTGSLKSKGIFVYDDGETRAIIDSTDFYKLEKEIEYVVGNSNYTQNPFISSGDLTGAINDLGDVAVTQDSAISQIQGDVADAQTDISTLKTAVASLENNSSEAMKNTTATADTAIADLKSKLADLKSAVIDFSSSDSVTISDVEDFYNTYKDAVTVLSSAISMLDAMDTDFNSEVDVLVGQLNDLSTYCDDIGLKLTAYRNSAMIFPNAEIMGDIGFSDDILTAMSTNVTTLESLLELGVHTYVMYASGMEGDMPTGTSFSATDQSIYIGVCTTANARPSDPSAYVWTKYKNYTIESDGAGTITFTLK